MATTPSLREAQKALTRNRLLDAAVEVFAQGGGLDATMDEIARSAGVTRATLYAHFPNKAAIIRGLAERMYTFGDELYAELGAMPSWTAATIRGWLADVEAMWRAQTADIRVLAAAGTAMRGSVLDPHDRFATLLMARPGRWDGVSAAEARQRCMMVLVATEGFFFGWIAGGWALETEDPPALLRDSLCHLLGPAMDAE
jgi:AcrR family transcriptional regulator